jgi:hypothetical protein
MVTVELAVGDTVSLKSLGKNNNVDHMSCYTLIKINEYIPLKKNMYCSLFKRDVIYHDVKQNKNV